MAEGTAAGAAKRKLVQPTEGQRFPYVSLPRALERTRELYALANVHEVALTTVVKHWGYGGKSSGGFQTAAALKAFGLVDYNGTGDTRKIKLTDSALKIIRDPRDISPDRDALIKQAALLPDIHSQVVAHYNGLPPSDEAFKAYLLLDKGMKEDSAAAFAKEFASTMTFAKMSGSAIQTELEDDAEPPHSGLDKEKSGNPKSFQRTPEKPEPQGAKLMDGERELAAGLLSKDAGFRLIVTGAIGVKEIERLIAKLELDKDILSELPST